MSNGGGIPAGSSRALRLDPFTLPVRFPARDASADERVRMVELNRDHVVVRRAVRGIRMAVSLPVAAFLGIAIRLVPDDEGSAAIAVVLEHRDPNLSIELFTALDGDEVVAEWQSWGRVLGLPLLIAERDGQLREPFARVGAVRVAPPTPRRRRHNAIKARRPMILLRRKAGRVAAAPSVHRDEREIVARN
jgi:Family of unknown function (DUF6101)